jgi:hypothetical protein
MNASCDSYTNTGCSDYLFDYACFPGSYVSPSAMSGFVGTWTLGSGTSSGGCQVIGTGITLDPSVAVITQVSDTGLSVSTFPPDYSSTQCANNALTISGTTASATAIYGCFGTSGWACSATLSYSGQGVPSSIELVLQCDVSTPTCIETFTYTLNRM